MPEAFSFKITGTPDQGVAKARAAAEKEGAEFSGDVSAGPLSALGAVGPYTISGDTVEVTISERPFFPPPSLVESKIKSLFR